MQGGLLELYSIVRGLYHDFVCKINDYGYRKSLFGRWCERVFWVIRFHVVKNRWSCTNIGIVLQHGKVNG